MFDERDEARIQEIFLVEKFSVYEFWADKALFKKIIDALAAPFKDSRVDKVIGLEARGFLLAPAVAYILGAGLVVARKGGKMFPSEYSKDMVYEEVITDYTKNSKVLEIEKNVNVLRPGDRVLIVDDWFETGAQGHAVIRMVKKVGAEVVGISVMLDAMSDEVRESFKPYPVNAAIDEKKYKKSSWF